MCVCVCVRVCVCAILSACAYVCVRICVYAYHVCARACMLLYGQGLKIHPASAFAFENAEKGFVNEGLSIGG